MAGSRIKGITIEIDGDTTKLTTALKKSISRSGTHRAVSGM
jgi:phage-related minor tail protein